MSPIHKRRYDGPDGPRPELERQRAWHREDFA